VANSILGELQDRLTALQEQRTLDAAKRVVKSVVSLLVPSADESEFRLFIDSDGKLTTKASWFLFDEEVVDRRATYALGLPEDANLDVKVFGVAKPDAKTVSWAVGLTPNFEDEPFNGRFKVGIDFIVPEAKDRVIIALSKNYMIRTIELKGHLTATFQEILSGWGDIQGTSSKQELHYSLWTSLDLQPINKRFYDGISQRFLSLRQYLTSNEVLNEQQAAQFANRLIGRIIFTWFLDKKNLLSHEFSYFESEAFEDDTEYYKAKLEPLFFEVLNTPVADRAGLDVSTPYLNGGLFEARPEDKYNAPELRFPRNYFDDFFEFLRGYKFTTDESTSEYQQVAIDPEMLGRIFENLLAEVSEETGEQARRAKGAFYTPREIVDFMCKESLKAYLRSCIAADEKLETRIYQLVESAEREFHDQDQNWRRDLKPYKEQIMDSLDDFKVIDPACGSGAFPIGMMQLLVKVYTRLEPRFDSYKAKLQIIEQNIYGVDIEPMAVEISRLRAWLSLIVESEDKPSAVEPLPNLDFKFVCADSLHGLAEVDMLPFGEDADLDVKLQNLRTQYFSTDSVQKKSRLRAQYLELVDQEETLFGDSDKARQLKSYRPFDSSSVAEFFDPEHMFGVTAFDAVIGNPPYVAPKGLDTKTKKRLESRYGFADDLYSHFFFRGFELLSGRGNLSYISSKTFWTIQTKKNLRELLLSKRIDYIYDTSNPFDSAMVDTCIVMSSQKSVGRRARFFSMAETYALPASTDFEQDLYRSTVNCVFFPPTEVNIRIHDVFNKPLTTLMGSWWPRIRTSTLKAQNQTLLNDYTKTLLPGDVALLGTIVDGGQGMATGNNGRYLGVIASSKLAVKVKTQREDRIAEFLLEKKIETLGFSKSDIVSSLGSFSEQQIFELVEDLKHQFGRDALGKGFIYRIIDDSLVAQVSSMDKDARLNGLGIEKRFVPYDKGDRDGNRWILPTPFCIDWSRSMVSELKASSGKKDPGSAVIRNPQFYFLPGVCWILTLNESSEYLKARIREAGVFDVNAMSVFIENNLISEKFLVALLNSYFIFKFKKIFINNTSAFQINDAKQLPIVIPTKAQLERFEELFDRAAMIKTRQYQDAATEAEISKGLQQIQHELDQEVLALYGIDNIQELIPTEPVL
jgi:hypothetical protein